MKKVLITGHRGFIGRNMIDHAPADWEITGVDIKSGVDARDFFRQSDERFDIAIHLAAVVGGREKIDGAPLDRAVDLAIDAEMIQWALRTRPGKLVLFSSSAAYPTALQSRPHDTSEGVRETGVNTMDGYRFGPDYQRYAALTESDIDLNDPSYGDALYGFAKVTVERLAALGAAEGLNIFTTRCASGYGSDQSLDYPFPSFIDRAVRRDSPFEIWGDGSQVRDWIHVSDICKAVLAAIDQDVQGSVNISTGRPTSFAELGKLVTQAVGYEPEFRFLTDKPTGVHTRVLNPSKLHEFYTPQVTLEEGIEMALKANV